MRTHMVVTGVLLLATGAAFAGPSASEEAATRQLNRQAAATSIAMNMPDAATRADGNGTAPMLAAMTNPPIQIVNAQVLDSSGAIIGAVQRIEVTPQGQPTQVAIALTGQDDRIVVLDARTLRYDAITNAITAQQSGAQIQSKAAS